MAVYIIKRILLMIPTFFAVSLIVFVVLNFAPGNPAEVALSSGDGKSGQSTQLSSQTRESYRIFKEQFNLDKPILVNTRFGIDGSQVRDTLVDLLAPLGEIKPARRARAEDHIEDWGQYAVPGLMEVLRNDPDRTMRAFASQRLAVNAQRVVKTISGRRLTDEERDANKAITRENGRVVAWTFQPEDTAEREGEIVAAWSTWYEDNQDRWEYTTGDKFAIFFGDTRFAKYWGNLMRLDFGISHVDKRPVIPKILHKLRYSVTLSLSAIVLVYFVSVPLGIWSAVRRNTPMDRVVTVVLFMLYSLPSFFVGVFLLNLLSRGGDPEVLSLPLTVILAQEAVPRSTWAGSDETVDMAVIRLRRGAPCQEKTPTYRSLVDDFFADERSEVEVGIMAAWEILRKVRGRPSARMEVYANGADGHEVVVMLPLAD